MLIRTLARLAETSTLPIRLSKPSSQGPVWDTVHPRHLFRALLRQCTYLPDHAARCWLQEYVVLRFRKYCPRPPIPPELTARLEHEADRKWLIKRALKGLRFLERANDGHPVHLGKILAMTYGRVGKRRRQLVAQLTLDNPPIESTTIHDQGPILGSQLKALLTAQMNNSDKSLKGDKLSLKPRIPETNTWGRPMPLNRVRNLKSEWYAEILDIIMPPLPEDEWNRLSGLASGLISWDGPVPRRKKVSKTGEDIISGNERDESRIDGGQKRTARNSDGSVADIHPVGGQDDTLPPAGTRVDNPIFTSSESLRHSKGEPGRRLKTNPHELTPRFMRRRWAEVFARCPTMTWDSVQNRWTVKWGSLQTKNESADLGQVVDNGMFEGVDDNGKSLQSFPGQRKK
ncbi:hypothetical protein MMC31_002943 [Peltigera leucophlebia]|nr:hypothetical protein [Peltigera leucophlebia]